MDSLEDNAIDRLRLWQKDGTTLGVEISNFFSAKSLPCYRVTAIEPNLVLECAAEIPSDGSFVSLRSSLTLLLEGSSQERTEIGVSVSKGEIECVMTPTTY
jgi:hypothetical protein